MEMIALWVFKMANWREGGEHWEFWHHKQKIIWRDHGGMMVWAEGISGLANYVYNRDWKINDPSVYIKECISFQEVLKISEKPSYYMLKSLWEFSWIF